MKKTVAALALSAILIPAAVFAGSHFENKMEHRLDNMTEQLQLSDQQRADVDKIFKEQHTKRVAMREQMRKETRQRLNAVLTPEQQAKWQQYRADRKQRFCDRHGKDDKGHMQGDGPRQERDGD